MNAALEQYQILVDERMRADRARSERDRSASAGVLARLIRLARPGRSATPVVPGPSRDTYDLAG